jgi:hypothetical protein
MSNPSQGLPIKTCVGPAAGADMVNMGVNDATPMWPVGTKMSDIFGNSYVYVKFSYTSAQGDAVTIDFTNALNTGGLWNVIVPTTATLSNFFGIAMNIVTSGNYGFVQVAGWNQVPLDSTTVTAGDFLKVANASSALVNDHAQGGTLGTGTGQAYMWGAVATTSAAAAVPAVGTVFIYGLGSVLAF